jgi:hypothetical protein
MPFTRISVTGGDWFGENFPLYEKYCAFREFFIMRKLQNGSLHAQAETVPMNLDRRFYRKPNQFFAIFYKTIP